MACFEEAGPSPGGAGRERVCLTTWRERAIASKKIRVNQEIRAPRVRVVDPGGEHGIYEIEKALELARKHELDLVEIAPNANPPVCKIIDYGKYRYEQQKKEKEQRKKAARVELKEVRFRPHTDTHDFEFKTRHARSFLEEGNKVRAYVQFRGRDIIYKDQGMDLLRRFIEELQDVAQIDQPPQMEGRRMATILAPAKKK
ncbi:MAG: translation initiation factor IF-3 [Bacteroidetes bacterium]|nr:translation initiation factor IF-3 [Rhodothermaceae bacterium RA]RMH58789.1 MAG: translation initiation factor IF-3 [Bacteroidota bacterium]